MVLSLFWLLFIAIFFFAFRVWGCGPGWRGRGRFLGDNAEDVLRGRFARGEIDEAEYRRLREILNS